MPHYFHLFMKFGLGLYRHMLTPANFRFAKQAGAMRIVGHWVAYFKGSPRIPETDAHANWGISDNRGRLWSCEELSDLKKTINVEGLELAAIENLDPSHWYDILLDGPHRTQQLEDVKTIVRALGNVGILCLSCNFSITGVWGHVQGAFARGGAESVGFFGPEGPAESPLPRGQVWNMRYDLEASDGTIGMASEQIWDRIATFLRAIVPVAEESGVRLAAHPDDPPMPALRGTARLVYQPQLFQNLLDIYPSYYNALEFCQGTVTEMAGGDVYGAIDKYSRQGNIAYVHYRNVRGKVPSYREVFLDEGDVDFVKAMGIYTKNNFDGVMIPDHAPRNVITPALREQYGTTGLNELVPNPFQPLFVGPDATFQEPSSIYNNATVPRIDLLRPYPQFPGAFGGDFDLVGSAWYNSLRVRFEKRFSHGFNVVGNYTYSKMMDNSSAGTNSWVGNSAAIQDRYNLRDEWSVGGSDVPHRFVFGWSYELPVGKGKAVGGHMSRAADAVVGGWQINGFTTFQSGTPLNITYAFSQLADGSQRPNLSGNPVGADIQAVVDGKGNRFNVSAFSAPGDQQPGNSPRFNSQLRGAGIGNLDFSLFKNIRIRETMRVQLRGEFFNVTNTPRFGAPNTVFGSAAFGTINSLKNSPRQAQMGARFLF